MNEAQIREANRIAAVFANWAKLRRELAGVATSYGYGITDSLDSREADELESAVKSLQNIESLT